VVVVQEPKLTRKLVALAVVVLVLVELDRVLQVIRLAQVHLKEIAVGMLLHQVLVMAAVAVAEHLHLELLVHQLLEVMAVLVLHPV
jgi:hypothetical protein